MLSDPLTAFEVSPLAAFGLLLVCGAAGGYLAHRVSWLPSITGFMLVGFLIGPHGIGVLSHSAMENTRLLVTIALGLILYRLGLSLNLRAVRQNPRILLTATIESVATFAAVLSALLWMEIPLFIAAVVAAIVVSSSPAVLLHVAHEEGAIGKVTDDTKTLVALNNCLSFVIFTAVLPILFRANDSDIVEVILVPTYRFLGSAALGALVGLTLHSLALRMRSAVQYRLALVGGALMLSIAAAQALQLSAIVVPLVMGIVVASVERNDPISNLEFGTTFEIFFIVLFVYAGANLHLAELVKYYPVILVVVAVRSAVKMFSMVATVRISEFNFRQGVASGLLLFPMAGMAIGLSQTTSRLFPIQGSTVSAIVLGAVAIFETIGPPIAKWAFQLCGEQRTTTTVD